MKRLRAKVSIDRDDIESDRTKVEHIIKTELSAKIAHFIQENMDITETDCRYSPNKIDFNIDLAVGESSDFIRGVSALKELSRTVLDKRVKEYLYTALVHLERE